MELILNVNKLTYQPFLKSKINAFIIAHSKYSQGQEFALDHSQLLKAIKIIKANDKKIYLNLNILLSESKLKDFKKDFNKIIKLDVDGYVVSDLGILNIFKKADKLDRVIFDPQTYLCNSLSVEYFLGLGVKRVCLSNELKKEEIFKISNLFEGKIEIMAYGLPLISLSKRKLLSIYFDYYNLDKKSDLYYLKEEKRDHRLPIKEDALGIYVYNDKPISILNDFYDFIDNKVKYFRIDGFLKSESEILTLINAFYKRGDLNE